MRGSSKPKIKTSIGIVKKSKKSKKKSNKTQKKRTKSKEIEKIQKFEKAQQIQYTQQIQKTQKIEKIQNFQIFPKWSEMVPGPSRTLQNLPKPSKYFKQCPETPPPKKEEE